MSPYILQFHPNPFNASANYKKTVAFLEKEGLTGRVREHALVQKINAMKIVCTVDVTFALERLPFIAAILPDCTNDKHPPRVYKFDPS